MCERLLARDRMADVEGREIALPAQRCFQQLVILESRHFDCAKCSQVICYKLRIEKPVSAGLQSGNQMNESNLRCISSLVKHALAEERPPKCHSIEASYELIAVIHFEAVAVAAL